MNNNQQFNRNFMKQQEYFLCAIKKTNDFIQQFLLFRVSLRRTFTRVHTEEKKWLNKVIIFVFVVHKMYHHCWTTDVPWNILMMSLLSRLALNGGGRIFDSPSFPIFPACSPVLSDLLRDSLCTALQTEKLWIWSTGLSTLLTPSFRLENWVPGNLSAPTERSQRVIRWTRGRGGKSYVLRLFPWRTLKISTYSEPW